MSDEYKSLRNIKTACSLICINVELRVVVPESYSLHIHAFYKILVLSAHILGMA